MFFVVVTQSYFPSVEDLRFRHLVMRAPPNKSLDASGGSVFRN